MRFLSLLILLAFPFLEIFLLVKLAHLYGWWLGIYLVAITLLGLQLIKGERILFSAKMMQSLSAGGNPVRAMLGSARNLVAGIFLMIPGVISDVIAVVLLLLPIKAAKVNVSQNGQQQTKYQPAANDDVIEGEFTEVKDDKPKI